MSEELDFKRWFRKNYDGWSEAYEPRQGSGVGLPDIQVLEKGYLIPIEMKVGIEHSGLLKVRNIRPAQISWHYRFWRAGGTSFILVGVRCHEKHWKIYELPHISVLHEQPKQSFLVENLATWDLNND